ncbi:hypothetical protein PFLU3_17900 [Pseudomonas fluorescens]|uniref:Uncharacterized protein n=1 Tax=Pseudomonas fluorescens TaxID=294 RepID=A0A0D0TGV5_PSEFL|nr:hypothetical protein PFLU3_17900 [Pseudomonas fluorescens]
MHVLFDQGDGIWTLGCMNLQQAGYIALPNRTAAEAIFTNGRTLPVSQKLDVTCRLVK